MPEPAATGNPAPADDVRTMFDRIAPRYEALNTAMTLGLDAGWRRSAVRATRVPVGGRAADVACGSGSLTRELARAVGPAGVVTGFDLSTGMLAQARGRAVPATAVTPAYVEGDALDLPLDDASVDTATIAFGLRNVADYGRCLAELARVVRPGGTVVVLEIARPAGRLGAVAAAWFERVVPLLGRLAGNAAAYRYLPASVRGYPDPEGVAALMRDAGLADIGWRRLRPGLVTLHVGRRT